MSALCQTTSDFFGKEYKANDPIVKTKEQKPSPTPSSSVKATPSATPGIKKVEDEDHDAFSENKYKITSIGILVSVVDRESANLYMDNLINTAIEHDLEIGDVIMIGSPAFELDRSDHSKFLVRGANIIAASEPPAKYKNIKTSPAYFLAGPDGIIILETTKNPGRYLTRENYYIEEQKLLK